MSTIPWLLVPAFVYAACAGLGVAVVLWSFHRRLAPDVLISCVAPICLWSVLLLVKGESKGPSNFILDPLVLGGAVCIMIAGRFALELRAAIGQSALRLGSIVACLAVAVVVFYLVPFLPREP